METQHRHRQAAAPNMSLFWPRVAGVEARTVNRTEAGAGSGYGAVATGFVWACTKVTCSAGEVSAASSFSVSIHTL